MEILVTILIAACNGAVAYSSVVLLRRLRRERPAPGAVTGRPPEMAAPRAGEFVARDPGKIYQGGLIVGEVLGAVKVEGDRVSFRQLANTTGLFTDQPFEYQQLKLRIVSVGERTGIVTNTTDMGTLIYRDVLGRVECERLS